MIIHMLRVRRGPFGGELRTSRCGRLNRACRDGLNVTDRRADVTCSVCRKRLEGAK